MARAPFASDPSRSRGRQYSQPASEVRDPFQRDRDRIIHATAFRRLKHKTQVFVSPDGDHFRTRLTHSLEVAQIGRVIARELGLHEDLTEALCLAHDLGHPPFGHVGEDVLTVAMEPYGGFDHNANTLRIVTRTEQRYELAIRACPPAEAADMFDAASQPRDAQRCREAADLVDR